MSFIEYINEYIRKKNKKLLQQAIDSKIDCSRREEIKKVLIKLAESIRNVPIDSIMLIEKLLEKASNCLDIYEMSYVLDHFLRKVDISVITKILNNYLKTMSYDEIKKFITSSDRTVEILPIFKLLVAKKYHNDLILVLDEYYSQLNRNLHFALLAIPYVYEKTDSKIIQELLDKLIKTYSSTNIRAIVITLVLLSYYLYLNDVNLPRKVISILDKLDETSIKILIKNLEKTPILVEAKAILWYISQNPSRIINKKVALRSILTAILHHRDNIILDAYQATIKLLGSSDDLYSLIKTLYKSKIDEFRILSAHLCGENISNYHFREILRKLSIDKKSAVRKTASSYLIKALPLLPKKELFRTINYLILSGHSETIIRTLEFLYDAEFNIKDKNILDFLRSIILKVSKDPRSTVILEVLKLLEKYPELLPLKKRIELLLNCLERFQNKSIITEQILTMIELTIQGKDSGIIDFLSKKIRQVSLSKDTYKRIQRIIKNAKK